VSNPRTAGASSVREQKLARVIDREVAPIWHDRFARLLLRELPEGPELFTLDVHSGPGHTTAELLQRLDESSRIVALGRDPWLMQVAKTRVRPEWKRRVYFKAGDIDDVTGMNDATYDLTIANLVLGEQVVEWQPALAELVRVTKPGGQVLVTLPLFGTWQEVEDLFEEMLRDEGMRKEVATLQQLRRRRPKPTQLVLGAGEIGLAQSDFVIEHERFELLFRSGREFLFAPVIEHGPLRLWKAIIGRAEKPQALFWRFKEAIDTYYAGRVLSVTVVAGVVRLRVPGGPPADVTGTPDFAGAYWSRYPSLARAWGIGATADASEAADASDEDFDLDIDLDEADSESDGLPADSISNLVESGESGSGLHGGFGRGFDDVEASGANELPAIDDAPLADDEDPFAGLLDELDAEAAARAEVAAEDAEAEAVVQPTKHASSGRMPTLGALGDAAPEPAPTLVPRPAVTKPISKPGDSSLAPGPKPIVKLAPKPGDSGAGLRPSDSGVGLKPSDSGAGAVPKPAPRIESAAGPAPKLAPKPAPKLGDSTVGPAPKPAPPRTESAVGPAPRLTPRPGDSTVGPAPKPAPRIESAVGPAPKPAPPRTESSIGPAPKLSPKVGDSTVGPAPPRRSDSSITPIPPVAPPKRSDSSITPIPPVAPPKRSDSSITPIPPAAPPRRSDSSITPIPPRKPGDSSASPLPGKLPPRVPVASKPGSGDSGAAPLPPSTSSSLSSKLPPPRATGSGGLAGKLPPRPDPTLAPPRSPGDSGTASLLSRLPKRPPSDANASKPAPSKPTGPQPQVTRPGEDDPFASMLDDDALEELDDDLVELPGSSLLHGEIDDDDPAGFGSGSRPLNPKKT
jgi:ubiquinone/menaquinone biosynthesis C-methylase UbiE